MNLRQRLNDIVLRAISRLHQAVIRVTGGRVGWSALGMQVVELHTTGRRTGLPRAVMLTAPITAGDRIILVASKNGDARNPDWYANLVANPDVEVVMKGSRRPMRARTATPEEKAGMWPQVTASFPHYARYQRRSSRDIPLVICEPPSPSPRERPQRPISP